MSPPVDLNQIWVNCSQCHKPYNNQQGTSNGKFWLTSCAHILCDKHYHNGMTVCPVCTTSRISVLPLDGDSSKLPTEVQSFFKPFVSQLEPLYTVANFQWESMVQLCEYYQDMCLKLQEKCNRQRQLLYQAKEELDKFTALKKELRMKDTNRDVISMVTRNDSRNLINAKDGIERDNQESFISKLQNSHRLKPSRTTSDDGNESPNISHVLAESTSIGRTAPILVPHSPTTPISMNNKSGSNINNTFGARSNSRQGVTKALPNALERLKLKRSSTSTKSSRGILSHMRINSSQTTTGFPSRNNTTAQSRNNKFKK